MRCVEARCDSLLVYLLIYSLIHSFVHFGFFPFSPLQVHINENFAKLSEALYIADRKAREAVEMRAQIEKKLAQKEKEKKEQNLRDLAQKAREERAGIHRPAAAATAPGAAAAAAAADKDGEPR